MSAYQLQWPPGALAIDQAFLDPENAGSAGVKPASITYGATVVASTGGSIAQIDADLRDALEAIGDSDLATGYWVMKPSTAAYLATLRGSGGAPAYPGVTARGGVLLGIPVITSNAVGPDANSPSESFIALVIASEVLLADDMSVRIDYTAQATLEMDDAPSAGAQPMVGLWQNGLVAIKAERAINWRRRRSTAAVTINGVTY